MKRAALILAAMLATLPRTSARAQEAGDALARGLVAYRYLDYDRAASLLRQALGERGERTFPDSLGAEAWFYLGAAEAFRGKSDSAAAAFRRAVAADPRHRADTLVFPPEIVRAFDAARQSTRVVHVVAAPGTALIRLYASAPHDLVVTLRAEGGAEARRLYAGPIGDSLELRWDGLDADGRALEGPLALEVTTGTAAGSALLARLPITTPVTRAARHADPPVAPAPDAPLVAERQPAAAQGWGAGFRGTTTLTRVRRATAGGNETLSGVVVGGEGRLAAGRFTLRAGYAEGTLRAEGNDARPRYVAGFAALGFVPLPGLEISAGPHARAWIGETSRERRLLSRLRARYEMPLFGDALRGYVEAWAGFVHAPSGRAAGGWRGGGVGAAVPFARRFALRVSYAIDRSSPDDAAIETTEGLMLAITVGRP